VAGQGAAALLTTLKATNAEMLTVPPVRTGAVDVRDKLGRIEYVLIAQDKNYAQAVEGLAAVEAQLNLMRQTWEQFTAFEAQRTAAAARVLERADNVRTTLSWVEDALSRAATARKQRVMTQLNNDLAAILTAWDARRAVAVDAGSLNEARAAADLTALDGRANQLSSAPERLQEVVAADAFNGPRTEAARELAQLQSRGGPQAGPLAAEFRTIVDQAAANYEEAGRNLAVLRGKLTAAIREQDQAHTAAVVAAKAKLTRAQAELAAVKSAAASEYGAFFDELKAELDGLAGMCESANFAAAAQAQADIEEVMQRARLAAAQAADPTPGTQSLRAVRAKTTELAAKLADAVLAEVLPTVQQGLKERWPELSKEAKKKAPAEACGRLKPS